MMLFLLPLMDNDTYVTSPTSYEKGMNTLATIYDFYGSESVEYNQAFDFFVETHLTITYKLIKIAAPNKSW